MRCLLCASTRHATQQRCCVAYECDAPRTQGQRNARLSFRGRVGSTAAAATNPVLPLAASPLLAPLSPSVAHAATGRPCCAPCACRCLCPCCRPCCWPCRRPCCAPCACRCLCLCSRPCRCPCRRSCRRSCPGMVQMGGTHRCALAAPARSHSTASTGVAATRGGVCQRRRRMRVPQAAPGRLRHAVACASSHSTARLVSWWSN